MNSSRKEIYSGGLLRTFRRAAAAVRILIFALLVADLDA